jgi:hypothetical protein
VNFQLDQKDFLTRAKELSRNNLLFIFSIIKAASIGLGVATFLNLFLDLPPKWSWYALGSLMPKFLLWTVSYGGLLVTFDIAMFSSIFLVHIPKRTETFFTFLLIGLEGLLFAILKPITDHPVQKVMSVDLLNWWFAIFFFYCTAITFLIAYGKKEIKVKDFKPQMKPFVQRYLKKFNLGLLFSVSGAVTSATIFFLLSFANIRQSSLIVISSLMYIVLLFVGFEIHHKQRRNFEKKLLSLNNT